MNDDERGKMLRRMCEYVFVIGEQNELSDMKLIFLWGNIADYLDADNQAQMIVNLFASHFTFYRNFYEAVEKWKKNELAIHKIGI